MSQQDTLKSAIQAGIQDAVRRPHFHVVQRRDDDNRYVYERDSADPIVTVDWRLVDWISRDALARAIADALNAACAGTVPTVGQDALDAARAMEAER